VAASEADADLNLYDEFARTRILEIIKGDGRAFEALTYLSGRPGLSERDVLDLVNQFLKRRQALAWRRETERDDGKMAACLGEVAARLRQDWAEARVNERALGYSIAPPSGDDIAALDRIRNYFNVRIAVAAKERALFGLTHKASPESAAIGAFAAEIKERVGEPCERAVVDLLALFVESLDDTKTVARCRAAYEGRRRLMGGKRRQLT
jgi:hypothetical protein